MEYKLPVDYRNLAWFEKREVREQYMKEQNNICMYCGADLRVTPPTKITDKKIDWRLFPENFLQSPVHLQHNHKTGMTEGAVHNYCNAVMWQYENR
jgi:hypothetical protein